MNEAPLAIKDCQYVASYNWLEETRDTILIPGAPPAWKPPRSPPVLKEDAGQYFRDANGARQPNYPTAPGIQSVFELCPNFTGDDIDVVACGNTMGSLLAFCDGQERTFRFGMEKIGRTIFLVRKENVADECIQGVYGYGHTFPEAYTSWDFDVKGSASYQRLIQYRFAGLTFLVRSESDGYLPAKLEKTTPTSTMETRTQTPQSLDLAALSMQTTRVPGGTDLLQIRPCGRVIPQTAIFDLKTRSVTNKINMNSILPRLWVNQTPNFVLAYHSRGKFNDIRIQDVTTDIRAWESSHQDLLRHLKNTLSNLISIVDQQPTTKKVEVRRTGQGVLQIWSEDKLWNALPGPLKRKWQGESAGAGDESDAEDGSGDEDNFLRF